MDNLPEDKIYLSQWLNPYDTNHLKAYKHLQDTGAWPQGFLPDYVVRDKEATIWKRIFEGKLAYIWSNFRLTNT